VPGTMVTLPDESGAEGAPLINQLLGRFVMVRVRVRVRVRARVRVRVRVRITDS
jgi:hypothetical protein